MSWKSLRRTLQQFQWLPRLAPPQHQQGFFFFYHPHQVPSSVANSLFLQYGASGFFFCHSGGFPFPRHSHPAYEFLSRGSFVVSYWPSETIWRKSVDQFNSLAEPFGGYAQGHFFLTPSALFHYRGRDSAYNAVCSTLYYVWTPLVITIVLFGGQLLSYFPLCS